MQRINGDIDFSGHWPTSGLRRFPATDRRFQELDRFQAQSFWSICRSQWFSPWPEWINIIAHTHTVFCMFVIGGTFKSTIQRGSTQSIVLFGIIISDTDSIIIWTIFTYIESNWCANFISYCNYTINLKLDLFTGICCSDFRDILPTGIGESLCLII